MTTAVDARREALEKAQQIAEAFGYTAVAEQNRRLLARLDEQEGTHQMSTPAAPTAADRARALRALLWSWLPEEPDGVSTTDTIEPTREEQRDIALALLEQVRDAQQFLASWQDRLMSMAREHGASNPQIGSAIGRGKERVRRRLQKEPVGQ